MTDPANIDVDPKATYVRLRCHAPGVSKIPNPLVDEDSGRWQGHLEAAKSLLRRDGGPDRRLDVDRVARAGWGFPFVETQDDELVDALAAEGHEPIPGNEFAAMIEEAPEYTYLRTAKPKAARSAAQRYRHLEVVDPDDLDATTVRGAASNHSE